MNEQIKIRGGKIHKLPDCFVISDEGGWLDGSYDSIESATLAIKNKSKDNWSLLGKLAFSINNQKQRNITVNDIREALN